MIHINFRDARPIYEQVKDGFCQLILSGALPPNYKLPSVRELASSLTINPNTIQRAYRALEQEGYIVSVPGKGSSACDGDRFDKLVGEMEQLGIPRRQLIEILKEGENQ